MNSANFTIIDYPRARSETQSILEKTRQSESLPEQESNCAGHESSRQSNPESANRKHDGIREPPCSGGGAQKTTQSAVTRV
jgi:hypothetical protein